MAPSMQKLTAPARSSPYPVLISDFDFDNIQSIAAWRKHVHASHHDTLPSAQSASNSKGQAGRQENGFRTFEFYQPSILSGLYRLEAPPTILRGTILRRLARLIGAYEIRETLRSLPSPSTKPLNFALLSSPRAVETEYNRILNLRDLFWVQQLLVEMRLRHHLRQYIPPKHLCDVRRVVARAEEAILYIQDFVDAHGLVLDYNAMKQKRCANLPRSHPLLLIQPFIRIDEIQTSCAFHSFDSVLSDSDYMEE